MEVEPHPSAKEKLFALELVLNSTTFVRCEQLKRFLKYVCTMEMGGRAQEISEYLIGVEALGRPRDYSPSEDSSVRNRAHALRQKLSEFYSEECPEATTRIELVKGSYAPRFVEVQKQPEPSYLDRSLPLPDNAQVASRRIFPLAVAFFVGVILAGVTAAFLVGGLKQERLPQIDPILHEAWGPLLHPQANVLICLSNAAQFTLVPNAFRLRSHGTLPLLEAPAAYRSWYLQRHRLFAGSSLYMVPSDNSPFFGDVYGAMIAVRTLTMAGASFQFLPERVAPAATLLSRNVVLFGAPQFSEAVQELLSTKQGGFEIRFDPSVQDFVVAGRGAELSSSRFFPTKRNERGEIVESYALISVFSSGSRSNDRKRLIIFSGAPSSGAMAATEFFTSPKHLLQFKERLKREGHSTIPNSYQIVVKCGSHTALPVSFDYVAHALIQ